MKFCRKCGWPKPLSDFGKDRGRRDGHTSACKECKNKQSAAWQKANPERVKEINALHKNNRKEYYSDPTRKLKYRSLDLERRFGLTHADYEEILAKQNGTCKICRLLRISEGKNFMPLDHCHQSGRIRGILCSWCNRALGLFEDDIELLKRAINYLILGDLI